MVTPTLGGGVVVAWSSNTQDGNGSGLFGRRFLTDLIFADGFE